MDIRSVKDIGGLVAYLVENLNWPAAVENVEDIADYMYDFTADDLGIRPEEFAKVESHLRNTYFKAANAPLGIGPRLVTWMQLV